MKKMAKLLSALLSISMLAGGIVSAEETQAPEQKTASYDFSDFTVNGTAPTGFTIAGDTWKVKPKAVEGENGTSVSLAGNSQLIYEIPSYPAGTILHLGFDYYQSGSGAQAWDFGVSADSRWSNIVTVDGSGIVNAISAKGSIEQDVWQHFDIKITIGESDGLAKCETFVNGVWTGHVLTGAAGNISNIIFTTFAVNDAEETICIDNFRFDGPNTLTAFSGEIASKYLYEGDTYAAIDFNDTIDTGSFWSAATAPVSVKKTDLETSAVSDVSVSAIPDGKKIRVMFDEPMEGNCKYTIYLSDAIKNMTGELVAQREFSFETRPFVDFYDDFENYGVGAHLKNDTTAGTGFVTNIDGKWLPSEVFNPYSNPIYGNNALYQYYTPEYTFPYAIDSGKFAISFDMVPGSVNTGNQTYLRLMNGTQETNLMGWYDGDLHVFWDAQPNGVAIRHQKDTWGHYDLVFDYDLKQIKIYMDNTYWATRALGDVTGIRFVQAQNNRFALDNFHARHIVNNIVTTDLTGDIPTGTKTAYIKFRDAVDPETVKAGNIEIVNEDLDPVEFTLKNVNWYGAEIEFTNALTKGMYEMGISGITGILGEALSQNAFSFNVSGEFAVAALSVVDEAGTAVTAAADWDAEKAYKVKASVTNTLGVGKGFTAIVAGFKGGVMTQAAVAEFKNMTASGDYLADLSAVDMKGATSIKMLAFDGMSTLMPLVTPAPILAGN